MSFITDDPGHDQAREDLLAVGAVEIAGPANKRMIMSSERDLYHERLMDTRPKLGGRSR